MAPISIDAQHLLDALPFDVLLVDGDRRSVWANRRVTERGGPAGGVPCWRLIYGSDDPPMMCPFRRAVATGEPAAEEFGDEATGHWMRCTVLPTAIVDERGRRLWLNLTRDVTARHLAERALDRSRRALATLSRSNQALVRSASESELLHTICRVIVETGGYRLAWVGYAMDDEAKTVRPVAEHGYSDDYLSSVRLTWADAERGRGPTGVAIRTGRRAVARDIRRDPAFEPWRADAVKRGYRSSAAFPLLGPDRPFGALNIYSAEPDAFDGEEIRLLDELAGDLAFGILRFRGGSP